METGQDAMIGKTITIRKDQGGTAHGEIRDVRGTLVLAKWSDTGKVAWYPLSSSFVESIT